MDNTRAIIKFGIYSSFALSVLTVITFGFAMIAIPPSGPNCPGNCMEYPFSDLLLYYPRDYFWMYMTIFQLFAFVIFSVSNHYIVSPAKKMFTMLSVAFTLISACVLLIAYFTQFSTIPISVMKGETDAIAFFTQYNEHGFFIAMEELGYITMSIALFFLAFAFSKDNKQEKRIRTILIVQLILTILSFISYSVIYGIARSYLFEVATITINWLVIIVVGIMIGLNYKKRLISQE